MTKKNNGVVRSLIFVPFHSMPMNEREVARVIRNVSEGVCMCQNGEEQVEKR